MLSIPPDGKGFTLIELLIVVAIIAILAAIAIPNFLEAQIRAKVARAKGEMRNLAVGIEAYAVDHNRYPWPADPFGVVLTAPTESWFETKVGPNLTTPVVYLTNRWADQFHPPDSPDEDPVYHLMTEEYTRAHLGSPQEFRHYVRFFGPNPVVVKYVLLSHGPDLVHRSPEPAENPEGLSIYDPTNGTISNGDILYFGPGVGFLN